MKLKNLVLKNYIVILVLVIVFLLLDQATKLIAVNILQQPLNGVQILPFFSFVLVYNTGVSFSFLAGVNPMLIALLSFSAMVIASVFLIGMFNKVSVWFYLSISFLIAGGLGNLIDRIRLHAVIDFLYVHYKFFSFPVFNVADICITFCGVIIVYKMLFTKNV